MVAGLASGAAAALLVWGLSLALRGAAARVVPTEPAPRWTEHAVVVRELGTGRYLVYTEIQVRPGDLLITPDGRLWRIEQVGFDTAWARPVRGRRAGPGEGGGPQAAGEPSSSGEGAEGADPAPSPSTGPRSTSSPE